MPLQGDLAHSMTIKAGTHLHDIVANSKNSDNTDIEIKVNSWHHAAIKNKIGKDLIASAHAPDEVVEAIEMRFPGNPNYWGLQFHPEYVKQDKTPDEYEHQIRIILAFQKACKQFQNKRAVNTEIMHPHIKYRSKL